VCVYMHLNFDVDSQRLLLQLKPASLDTRR
jgi:hypothetical protein